jgi:hypothetical protein
MYLSQEQKKELAIKIRSEINNRVFRDIHSNELKSWYKQIFAKDFKNNCGACEMEAHYDILKFIRHNENA